MEKADFNSHLNSLPKPEFIKSNKGSDTNGVTDEKGSSTLSSAQTSINDQPADRNLYDQSQHDPDEIWKIVLEYLRMNVSERDIRVWYKNVYLEKIENGVATLSCDNVMKREWIESYHKSFIRNRIQEVIGYKPDLMITIRSTSSQKSKKEDAKGNSYEYWNPANNEQQSLFSGDSSASSNTTTTPEAPQNNLNPRYMMSNFIVGSSNQLAYAVAEGVVNDPGTAYNPVFYYGPSGVGKTHLMQAIGNAITRRNPSAKVVYVPIETFMNEMIEAIRTTKNEEFRKKYRPVDLLIIDDIQFISTAKKTKEELFNTFNALYEANKQIVIASDRPPHEIDNLPDRLKTRFQGGMVVDIQVPDLETRIAILQQEANEKKAEVPREIIMFIAQNVENSVRELEGAVNKIITIAQISNGYPDMSEVARILQVDTDSKRRRVKPDDVIQTVSEVFDLSPKDIKGKRRTAYIALARQVVMFLLREELQLPLEQVASCVNRKDHTTVLHACEKIESVISQDDRIKNKVDECRAIFAA